MTRKLIQTLELTFWLWAAEAIVSYALSGLIVR
jgi:hypothetical protein